VEVFQYHLNEGHSALLILELLRRFAYPVSHLRPGESRYDIPRVRNLCNFTTHTPVEAGHDQFSYALVQAVLGDYFDVSTLKSLAGHDRLNMTRLALNLSLYVNGVARRHAATSMRMFPGYQVRAITNGVHSYTWTCGTFGKLYDVHFPGWCHEPELLVGADRLPSAEVWAAHQASKERLLQEVQARRGVALDPEVMTIGFARRMTTYKRPEMLFSSLERLAGIAKRPFQVVIAGKAHPRDLPGKQLIVQLHEYARQLAGRVTVVFLPDYDMEIALAMVAGVDLWLNTPLPPMEASGTSGMKSALNGVPNLSVLDGWWVEGFIDGVTGWAIGEGGGAPERDAESLYQKLEQTVLPLFYDNRDGWIAVMKGAIGRNGSAFNAHRMMRRYAADAYLS
jgi:starch phosphorylase